MTPSFSLLYEGVSLCTFPWFPSAPLPLQKKTSWTRDSVQSKIVLAQGKFSTNLLNEWLNEWIERASCRGWKLYIRETVSDKSSGQHNWSKSYVLRQIPSTSVTVSGRPVTSEMICRANMICHVSSYHLFLIGGYQFSVFLIDSSNTDTLSAVYSSLIAGQTLLKCQYLLFFLEHHFQKDCNSFGDTSLIFNAQGVQIQTKSSFYYSLPLLWSQGWLTYQPPWLPLAAPWMFPLDAAIGNWYTMLFPPLLMSFAI